MRLIDLFIRRPVLSLSISFMIIVVGVGSFFQLQVRQYPYIDSATITVTTAYPGANPATIQAFVTRPIEAAVGSSKGIDYMTSSSALGTSTITVYVKLGQNTNDVLSEVVQNVNSVLNQLPQDAYSPAIKLNPADNFPSLILAFTSKTMNTSEISAYINSELTPKLLAQGGLSSVDVWGNKPYAMRIYPNKTRMAEYGITPTELATAIGSNSLVSAGGQIQGPYLNYTLNPETSMSTAQEYRNLIIKKSDKQVVRLKDVAKVELGAQDYDSSVYFDGKNAVLAGAVVSPEENPLDVVDRLVEELPNIKAALPNGLDVNIAYNSTTYIEVSIEEVLHTLFEAVIIVSVVMFLFLGSFRAIIVPVVAIPLSIIGSFFLMSLMGFSINLLTLLSMILAIGLVVDDAIVVLENIYRHIEEGMEPFAAAIKGAREIANPVILMTLTLVVVYAPIGMMGGFTGQLFTEFAYSLAGAVVISGIVAYTLSPMLCSKILNREMMSTKLVKFIDKLFTALTAKYKATLEFVLDIKPAIAIVGLIVLASCFIMGKGIKSELAPNEDMGFLGIMGQAPSSANINYLETFGTKLASTLDEVPGKQDTFILNGVMGSNVIFGGFIMQPWDKREISQQKAAQIAQAKVTELPGIQTYTYQTPALPGIPRGAPLSLVIQSVNDYEAINEITNKVIDKMMKSGLFVFAQSDLKFDNPVVDISIDREKAGILGITMSDIAKTLGYSYAGGYINYFFLKGYSFQVIPQLARNEMLTQEQLGNIYIRSDEASDLFNSELPLSALVSFKTEDQPLTLNTFQQLNASTISAVMAPGVTQGQAIDYVKNVVRSELPEGFSFNFSGSARQYIENGNTMMVAFAFAIVLIFLALSAQFESFRDSLVILVTIPMAISGALIPLYVGQYMGAGWASLNIYTQLGLVTLIGLISKQGIMVVEFANHLQKHERMNKYDAIVTSSSQRLRPILMTVSAMVVGVIPLVTSSGAGAISRNCIGVVISSGLVIGAIFSLFVLPVVYMYIASDKSIAVKTESEQQKIIDNLSE
ncbi:efflux RND transporter permease subunit [Francisella philomiragia]|uniref:RND efflux transporter, AcrB/AcrD/AcrF family n=1 Tax=Francisella philomiragia subsp. philomiragia (strain ATCC 25017 / CCUG 19701 / FSC 153 / O\|nr:efflux RND transporter permease subunit [Francisella philomiragia]AJI47255.1 acrB/AcrD/AcrF family protein [Francisella philomiragia]AJI48289.1 acrB/AcrD/AcrF family protein [Francisella philomiragia]MBK2020376.1 efflux RND transporter permease subunit [Francisella philomiragia]MBK2030076.1 efflux RND transporter permease subunit [Francisella philomiragia]MBK2263073.1 efflux RND transporter permease subunit [Francisella philomiragia]